MHEQIEERLGLIIHLLTNLERKIDHMANTQADLDAALATVEASVTKLGTDLTTGIALLQKELSTGVDTSASVARLSAIAAKLSEFDAEVVAAETPASPAPAA